MSNHSTRGAMKSQSSPPTRFRILDFAVLALIFAFLLEAVLKVHGAAHIGAVSFVGVLVAVVVRTLLVPIVQFMRRREFGRSIISACLGLGAVALIAGSTAQIGASGHVSQLGEQGVLVGAWLFVVGLIG